MAAIPATINVNFTSNYAGGHRVCWRIGNAGPYNCSTVVTCLGGGNPCSANIAITVDNETCDAVTFEGYVQAVCEDIGSLNGRVPFSSTFTPDPTCDSFNITCNSVGLAGFVITNPGSGYTPGVPPLVTIVGTGTLAAGTAVVGDGGIKTETITNGGAAYNGGGTAIFLNVPAVTLTGVGTGAIYDVTVTTGVVTSIVLSASPTAPGLNYAIGDTFEFSNANLGGTGAGVVITVDTLNTGEIQHIILTNPGSGYTAPPAVTMASGGGIIPTASPVMAPCGALAGYFNCDATPKTAIPLVSLGHSFNSCFDTTPVLPAGYQLAPQDCCYDCVNVVVDHPIGNVGNADLYYTACDSRQVVHIVLVPGATHSNCMVNGSWLVEENDTSGTTTVTPGAVCP